MKFLISSVFFIISFQLSSQVTLTVRVDSGSSGTSCTDGAFGGGPELQWRVQIAGQGYTTYPQAGGCYVNPPNTQYNEVFNCALPASLQVCFRAFEDDGATCIVSESCLEQVCQNFATPTPGSSITYNLMIPNNGSNTSWGDVNFTITATGSFSSTGIDTQIACDSYTWTDGITYTVSNTTALDTFVNALGCDSVVTLDLTIVSSDTIYAGADTSICIGTTLGVLAGNIPVSGSGFWTSLGSATVDVPTQYNSTVSGLVTGTNQFVWTITNSPCPIKIDTVNLIVEDTTLPVITCLGNQNVFYDGSCQYTLPDYIATVTVSDNCGLVSVTQTPLAGTVLTTTQLVTLIADDGNGNIDSCQFSVVPSDTILPVIICPGNQNVYYDGSCQYTLLDYTTLVITSDNCGPVSVTQNPIAGTVITSTQTVTFIADDGNGNIDSCQFDVVPTDTIPPVITCPGNQNVFYDGNCQYTLLDYTTLATTNDNCGAVSIIQNPISGTIINTTQGVTLTVIDGSGNKDSCTFDVIPTDTISPIITCPSNQNVFYDGNCEYMLLDYTTLAITSDNCGVVSVTQTPLAGSILAGVQLVTLIADDGNGNKDSCTFDVIPSDTIPPMINCPGNQTVYYDSNCEYTLPDYTGLATTNDNCSSVITITQFPTTGTVLSTIQTVTLLANDGNGNIDSCLFNVIPLDTIAPMMTCLSDISSCFSIINFSPPIAIENCGIATVTQTAGLPSGSNFPVGITTNTFFAQDTSGNTSTCSFNVTIFEKPVAAKNTLTNVTCNGFSDGGIDVNVTNGLLPYTYLWSNGEITEDVNALSAGNYTVVVTDGNTCKDTLDITITEPLPLDVSKTIINNGCYGISEGSINVIVSGGTLPYSYNWDIGDTTTTIVGLLAGNYSITVTDSHNCVINQTYTVYQPNEFVLDGVLSEFFGYNVSENGFCDGTIDLTVSGGFEPYQFNWSSGDTTKNVTGLCAGTYTVEVTDLDQCQAIGSFTLIEPEPVIIPEGFSPNADGINDVCIIDGLDVYPNNSIEIYNRWGNITYKASPYHNDWDGISSMSFIGKEAPDGSYFYKLQLKDDKKPIVGYIVLKR
ncbi:MAG: HYR domain-containing protein [Vicingus serpentipes]|nr:HYR domain-containing protein [Vicingus serpentipes]